MNEEGIDRLSHMREHVKTFSFFTLILEAILIGLSFAIATVCLTLLSSPLNFG